MHNDHAGAGVQVGGSGADQRDVGDGEEHGARAHISREDDGAEDEEGAGDGREHPHHAPWPVGDGPQRQRRDDGVRHGHPERGRGALLEIGGGGEVQVLGTSIGAAAVDGAVLHRGGGHAVLYQDDVVHGVEGTIICSSVVAISHVVA